MDWHVDSRAERRVDENGQIGKENCVAAILGIDAAWTEKEPSGVALIEGARGGWRCVAVTPSYGTFLALAEGTPVD